MAREGEEVVGGRDGGGGRLRAQGKKGVILYPIPTSLSFVRVASVRAVRKKNAGGNPIIGRVCTYTGVSALCCTRLYFQPRDEKVGWGVLRCTSSLARTNHCKMSEGPFSAPFLFLEALFSGTHIVTCMYATTLLWY